MSSLFFSKYEHMDNHYQCDLSDYADDLWIATEKIHGCNYSFICDGTSVSPAKRNSMLDTETNFNNHGRIFDLYKDDVIKLFNSVVNYDGDCVQIQLYGELFGGNYNGKKHPQSKIIQANMNYCEDNDFMAFDIKVTKKDNTKYMCDYETMEQIFKSADVNIKLAPVVIKGNLTEIFNFDPKFESIIYKSYGLEKMENNFAEGLVVRLYKNRFIHEPKYKGRPIFKYKNPQFAEKVARKPILYPVEKNEYVEKFQEYLTFPRVENIKSALSRESMLYEDILVDYRTDEPTIEQSDVDQNYKKCYGMCKGFLYKNKFI